jgi:CRP/FNR family cyclic AMP-dependent transcriptional regulator
MEDADTTSHLRRQGVLANLPEAIFDDLVDGAVLVDYPSGSVTFGREHRPRVAVVASGLLRVYLSAPDGRQITIRYARVGDLVGNDRSPGPSVNRGTQAIENSTLLHLDPSRLERLARQSPELAWALAEDLSKRLSAAHRSLAMRAFGNVRARVAHEILQLAQANGGPKAGMHVKVTHQELADATGSVRDVVARATRELRRESLLGAADDGVVLLDPDRLQLAAGLEV